MKILLVSNQAYNNQGVGNPIMYRMCDALSRSEHIKKVEFLPFENSLFSLMKIRRMAKQYDIIHVHFGGLYALCIWFALCGIAKKKIITFHGTDIHAKAIKSTKSIFRKIKIRLNQWSSFLCIALFDKCGFVAEEMMRYVPKSMEHILVKKAFTQPLGVDYMYFNPIDKFEAQSHLGLAAGKYVLFSDVSNSSIKRRDVAEKIVKLLGEEYTLLVMCGVRPSEVPMYINASDFLLLTSDEEGSPNIIRECLALNKRIFSVDVGDVALQLLGLQNSQIISRTPQQAVDQIRASINNPYVDNTRINKKAMLDFMEVNSKVVEMYQKSL